jgi:hypothetical protein
MSDQTTGNTTSYSLSYDLNNTSLYNPNLNKLNPDFGTSVDATSTDADLSGNTVPGNRTTSDCISYTPSSLEIILPSPIILSTLCVSTDKTSLFIISLVRLLFYVLLYHVMSEIMDFNAHNVIQYTLLTFIVVNIMYIGFVVSKSTVFSINNGRSMFELTEFKDVNNISPTKKK